MALSPSAQTVAAALAVSPQPITARELSETIGLGYSTVTAALKRLADTNRATVIGASISEGGRKAPATYGPTPALIAEYVPDGNLATATAAALGEPAPSAPKVDDERGWEYASPEGQAVPVEIAEPVTDDAFQPSGMDTFASDTTITGPVATPDPVGDLLAAENYTPPTSEPARPSAVLKSGQVRLGRGSLREQVQEHYEANRGTPLTPGAVAKALGGRSSGAVRNAAAKLAELGSLVKVGDKPETFVFDPAPGE